MDVLATSLDALLQVATNPSNEIADKAAEETFSILVNKDREGCHIAVKLITNRLHSKQEKQVLWTLHLLNTCMQKCGPTFQAEIGKFRFLNELIKLVSPKYLASQTPLSVRQKVLQLMYLWTLDYPKEIKIREAYDMLRKQGVIRDTPFNICINDFRPVPKPKSTICDEERSRLLQKLLQSKNPEDLQAANRLIKCMVKEDDKRIEIKNRRLLELEAVHSNVRLLSEMLDAYIREGSSQDDLDLIKELHQSCERFRPIILKLAADTQHSDDILNILSASDELTKVFGKYKEIIIEGERLLVKELSLLDLGNSTPNSPKLLDEATVQTCCKDNTSEMDALCDIFMNPNVPESLFSKPENPDILKPISLSKVESSPKMNGKLKAFEEIDVLGENLLRQNLQPYARQGGKFQRSPAEKIPMNKLLAQNEKESTNLNGSTSDAASIMLNFDVSCLLESPKIEPKTKTVTQSNDDILVDITDNSSVEQTTLKQVDEPKNEIKLSDIYVDLDNIKPSRVPPVIALEEKGGISVTLHFAHHLPRDDIAVIVVTIASENKLPLKNVLFRAVVPKECKVKLQPPSSTELQPHNPFLPPSAITQIMLIANPEKVKVSLRFIVSYNIDDETITEMGEVECLPKIEDLQD